MKIVYSRFAGQSLDRLASLSDGTFAFAMTLLVLDLRNSAPHSHAAQLCNSTKDWLDSF